MGQIHRILAIDNCKLKQSGTDTDTVSRSRCDARRNIFARQGPGLDTSLAGCPGPVFHHGQPQSALREACDIRPIGRVGSPQCWVGSPSRSGQSVLLAGLCPRYRRADRVGDPRQVPGPEAYVTLRRYQGACRLWP